MATPRNRLSSPKNLRRGAWLELPMLRSLFHLGLLFGLHRFYSSVEWVACPLTKVQNHLAWRHGAVWRCLPAKYVRWKHHRPRFQPLCLPFVRDMSSLPLRAQIGTLFSVPCVSPRFGTQSPNRKLQEMPGKPPRCRVGEVALLLVVKLA